MMAKNAAARARKLLMLALLTLTVVGAAGVAGAQDRDHREHRGDHPYERDVRRHDFFDNRYGHAHYYPRRGAFVRVLPGGYRSYYFRGRPYFFVGGAWYINGPGGFVVAPPPFGLMVSVLPPFYTIVRFGGVPYYYADDVYYQWDAGAGAYRVIAPPPGADQTAPEETPPAPSAEAQLYIYPKNGQTQEKQERDRYECHTWSTGQTGFDPTQPGGGVSPDQNEAKSAAYRRAMTACLEARGYSVN